MRRKGVILLCMVLLLGSCVLTGVSAMAMSSPNLPPEQWVGKTFLFHALPADRQGDGYEIFKTGDAERGWAEDRSVWIPYAAHAYKRVRVTNVVVFPAGTDQKEYLIYMIEKDTGMKLVGRTVRSQLEGLLLEADLNQARKQFIGKKVYVKKRFLELEDKLGGDTPQTIAVKIASGVQVVGVRAGIRTDEPIQLIVLVDGQRAVLPLAYSWTNIRSSAWKQTQPWQEVLFTEDPRARMGWPQEVWDKVEAGSVDTGMTKNQVELSWGPPEDIIDDPYGSWKSVWKYGTSSLIFKGDCLISVEN
ncbi:hypothetical protein SRRS_53920 [Sporomusa rhizae]|uniref:hypothetical protein n=1 Tax=Sporomusa rhizae TaxID=357999 RepID=UPI00352AF1FE